MAWFALVFGLVLLLAGFVGQFRHSRNRSRLVQEDRSTVTRFAYLGGAVIGAWLMIFLGSHLLHFGFFRR